MIELVHTQILLVGIQCASVVKMMLRHRQEMIVRCWLYVLEYHNILILKFDNSGRAFSGYNIAKYARFLLGHFALHFSWVENAMEFEIDTIFCCLSTFRY